MVEGQIIGSESNSLVKIKEYKGQRVVTFKDIDFVHGKADGTAKKRFSENREHFIEEEDFYLVKPSDIRKSEFVTFGLDASDISNRGMILMTETGYLMIVKSFHDDKSWEVQRSLVNTYFRAKEVVQQLGKPIDSPLTREELAAYMICNERYLQQAIKVVEAQRDETRAFMENQTKVLQSFCDTATSVITRLCGIELNASATQTPTLPSLEIDIAEVDEFSKNANSAMRKILTARGDGTKDGLLNEIYIKMRKDGHDLNAATEELRSKTNYPWVKTFYAVASNPTLRNAFERQLRQILLDIETPAPSEFDNIRIVPREELNSKLVCTTPQILYDKLKPLIDQGSTPQAALNSVYHSMARKMNASMTSKAIAYGRKMGVTNVRCGWVITQDRELFNLFTQTANEIIAARTAS